MRGSEPEPPQTNRIAKDRFAEIAGSPAGCAPAARPAATEGGKPRQVRKEAAVAAQSVCRRLPWPPAGPRRAKRKSGRSQRRAPASGAAGPFTAPVTGGARSAQAGRSRRRDGAGHQSPAGGIMAYEALSRKWRPKTFCEIVGQGHVTRSLANAISLGKIHHAYLFAGTRGVGKTTFARILARALNCQNEPTSSPCLTCPACVEI